MAIEAALNSLFQASNIELWMDAVLVVTPRFRVSHVHPPKKKSYPGYNYYAVTPGLT